jgi:hypothetical protein
VNIDLERLKMLLLLYPARGYTVGPESKPEKPTKLGSLFFWIKTRKGRPLRVSARLVSFSSRELLLDCLPPSVTHFLLMTPFSLSHARLIFLDCAVPSAPLATHRSLRPPRRPHRPTAGLPPLPDLLYSRRRWISSNPPNHNFDIWRRR